MRVLIDECHPAALKGTLTELGHECETVRRAGYGAKKNGELLSLAEGRWDVLLTSDRNIKYQQNRTGRNISILILIAKTNGMKAWCRSCPPVLKPCSVFHPVASSKSDDLSQRSTNSRSGDRKQRSSPGRGAAGLLLTDVLLVSEVDAVGVLELGHIGEDDAVALF